MFDIDKLNKELYKKSIFNTECRLVKCTTTEEWCSVTFRVTSYVGDFSITTRTYSNTSLVNITVDIDDCPTHEYNILSDIFDVYEFMVDLCMMMPIVGRDTRKEVIPESADLDRDRIVLTRVNISTITVDVSETTISVQYESHVGNTETKCVFNKSAIDVVGAINCVRVIHDLLQILGSYNLEYDFNINATTNMVSLLIELNDCGRKLGVTLNYSYSSSGLGYITVKCRDDYNISSIFGQPVMLPVNKLVKTHIDNILSKPRPIISVKMNYTGKPLIKT